jgi:tetratricopeptide (TPR) repeat protein
MYRHSPKVFRSFLIGCALSLVGGVFVALDLYDFGVLDSVPLTVAAGLLTLFLCQLINTSRCKKMMKQEQNGYLTLLWDQCDPEKFVKYYAPTVEATKGNDPFALTYRNQLATGYVAKGDFENADRLFSQVLSARETNSNAQYIRQANLFRCELWFLKGDADKLSADLEAANELLQRLHPAAKLYPFIKARLERNEMLLSLLRQENPQQVVEYFQAAFQQDKTPSVKVMDQHCLALAQRQLGNADEEKAALRYVAEHGKTMLVATLAKERLAELK